ncbi:DNA polymerase III subunit alpha [Desulfosporosinus sp. OT]|nr:DNA polymerase III subunit alpha [Desulfosporosinus sp. OT]
MGRNKRAIEQYIRKQLEEDIAADQLTIKEFVGSFTGEPVEKTKRK